MILGFSYADDLNDICPSCKGLQNMWNVSALQQYAVILLNQSYGSDIGTCFTIPVHSIFILVQST